MDQVDPMSLAAQTDAELDSYLSADLDADLDVEFFKKIKKFGGKALGAAKTGIRKLFGRNSGRNCVVNNNNSRQMAKQNSTKAIRAMKNKALLTRKKKKQAKPLDTRGAKYGKKLFG